MNKVMIFGCVKSSAVTQTFNNFTKTTLIVEVKESYKKQGTYESKYTEIPIEFYGDNKIVADNLQVGYYVFIQGKLNVRKFNTKSGAEMTIISFVAEYTEIVSKTSNTLPVNAQQIQPDKIPF